MTELARRSARTHALAGTALIFLVLGGISVWAARTEISGAVLSPGVIVVESEVKKVQHPTGGIVSEILVSNGSRVSAGDILIQLDETVSRASLQMITKQLDELAIREARLQAEQDGAATITLPETYAGRETEPEIIRRIAGETAFFTSRRATMDGQKNQLAERIRQYEQEINGLERQAAAKTAEIEIITRELEGVARLEEQQLVTTMRVNQLRRDATRLEGERGQLESAMAQAKGRIAETEVELLRIEQDFRTTIIQELRDNRAKQTELLERRIAADDHLKRMEIRAPQSGIVHELGVHTIGGVINPAESIMLIVPDDGDLIIESRVQPHDIDQILEGEGKALVRLSAFNQQTTPELTGDVVSVSADLSIDRVTGAAYYLTRIKIPKEERAKLEGKRLVPGMPADVHIQTGDRTVLSYLVKPIQDQMERAFRER
ncbi:MAG: HlyD family type I secretion periplasmic adaptor subunit [Alphaproteobacteria bacterium]|nr:HlyD family type I secretion periplasmic adaptor subunit [Alphaproteobacteria bacterium]